jgi:hypothetical protein
VIDSGIAKTLVNLFQSSDLPIKGKLDIAWIFTNLSMAKSEQVNMLFNRGVVEALVSHILLYKGKITIGEFSNPLNLETD